MGHIVMSVAGVGLTAAILAIGVGVRRAVNSSTKK